MVHKIALNGFGRIRNILYAGTASLNMCEVKPKQSDVLADISTIVETKNIKTLVEIYQKVQHKYYPEKDVFKG